MTYSEPARAATRRIRIRRIRVAVLLVVIAAIAALSYQWPASSSSTAAPPIQVLRRDHPGPLGEIGGAAPNGRLGALGEADGAVPDGTTVFDDDVPGVAKLDSDLLGALHRAAADAAGDGVEFYLDSGWRSAEYQEQLLREAISKYGMVSRIRVHGTDGYVEILPGRPAVHPPVPPRNSTSRAQR